VQKPKLAIYHNVFLIAINAGIWPLLVTQEDFTQARLSLNVAQEGLACFPSCHF